MAIVSAACVQESVTHSVMEAAADHHDMSRLDFDRRR
jgi:hypothetical protein